MVYKHTLDPSPKKFTCPACNKKRFVRYINTETGEYLPHEYGRCDREVNCAYHLNPSVTPSFKAGTARATLPLYKGKSPKGEGVKSPDYIDFETFRQTLPNQKQNNFVQFLKTIFPREIVKHLILTYFIGASKHWPGATIFWQIDKHEKVHTGQVILFDATTGKRIKKPYPHITWVHSLLIKQGKLKSFNLQQCLFGEHQLIDSPTNKPIAIVESAKSAIIMTGFYPSYIWMATNGRANLNAAMLQPLLTRNIILYPDLGQYDNLPASLPAAGGKAGWNGKAEELMKQGFKITTSNLLEKNATPEDHNNGLDIADYFISTKSEFSTLVSAGETQRGFALSNEEGLLHQLAQKNPLITHLINTLGLVSQKTGKTLYIHTKPNPTPIASHNNYNK